jgi:hypothetical protein
MKLCGWKSAWFGRVDVEMCPAEAVGGEMFCPVHRAELFELAEADPERAAAIVARERIGRLYRRGAR